VAQFKAHPEWFVCTILERGYADDVVMGEDEERRITESWGVPGRINRKGRLPVFERDAAWRANSAAANRKKAQDPVWKAAVAAANRKSAQDPVWRANSAAANRKRSQDPEYQETMRKLRATPEWKAKQVAGARAKAQDPVHRANVTAANRKIHASPEFGKRISDGMKRARALREADTR